jgi:putative ABC transport system permease protein
MIYFVFTSIQYNQQVLDLTRASLKADTGFKAAAIIIAVFSALFIWYSNSFFTKKRKKEVALYCMLGVRKRQVARMLFYENLVMGAIALFTGIIIGSLFTKLFIMILLQIMNFNVSVIFAISMKAILNTTLVFFILFTLTSFHGYSLIYRFQLVELFKSESKNQGQPKSSLLFGILAMILIGAGYYLAFNYNYTSLLTIILILVITVLGTYFLFSSLMVVLVKLSKKHKRTYFKNLNIVNTSMLLFRIKSHSRTLATIAVLSATTLTAIGVASSLYYDQTTNLNTYAPFSYTYSTRGRDIALNKKVDHLISKYPQNKIETSFDVSYLEVKMKFPNLNKVMNSNKKKSYTTVNQNVMSESDLKKIMSYRKINDDFTLKDGETIEFFSFYYETFVENPTGKKIFININNNVKTLTIKTFKEYLPINKSGMQELIVVKDDVYKALSKNFERYTIRAIDINEQKNSHDLTSSLTNLVDKTRATRSSVSHISAYYTEYVDTMSRFGLIIFLAAFIGMVFLICTGSIIFFKQLSEASEDKSSYEILRKIGVNKKQIKLSIAKQMLFIFSLPLLVAIAHCSFALSMLRPLITTNMLIPTSITVAIYTLIYLTFYLLTVNSYNKIVNS